MTEIEFPAVTICSQGLNMENVARAVERDFYNWHTQQQAQQVKWSKKHICCDKLFQNEGGRNKRDTLQDQMSVYLKDKFDIGEDDPSLLGMYRWTKTSFLPSEH